MADEFVSEKNKGQNAALKRVAGPKGKHVRQGPTDDEINAMLAEMMLGPEPDDELDFEDFIQKYRTDYKAVDMKDLSSKKFRKMMEMERALPENFIPISLEEVEIRLAARRTEKWCLDLFEQRDKLFELYTAELKSRGMSKHSHIDLLI